MKYLKVLLFVFNIAIWTAGCTLTVIGMWLVMDPDKGHLLNLFASDSTPHDTIHIVGYGFVALGIIVLVVGFFGCRAALHHDHCALAVYLSMLIALTVAEVLGSGIIGISTYRVLSGMETRMTERLEQHYGHDDTFDTEFTESLDFAQFKFNCCGIHSDEDFNGTAWWRNSQISGDRKQVPLTCCVSKDPEPKITGSPMYVISRVLTVNNEKLWLKPQPKDEASCQSQDAEVHRQFRFKEGCLEKVREWLRYESFALILFGLAIATAQIFGIMFSACLCKTTDTSSGGSSRASVSRQPSRRSSSRNASSTRR